MALQIRSRRKLDYLGQLRQFQLILEFYSSLENARPLHMFGAKGHNRVEPVAWQWVAKSRKRKDSMGLVKEQKHRLQHLAYLVEKAMMLQPITTAESTKALPHKEMLASLKSFHRRFTMSFSQAMPEKIHCQIIVYNW